MTEPRPEGLYFEEFYAGQSIEGPARTVTEDDVMQFAELSGDHNPLHVDAEFARQTPYGQRIAHGLLGLSIVSGLLESAGFMRGTALAFIGLTWKFRAPILFGDAIHFQAKISKTRPVSAMGGGMVVLEMTVLNQHGRTVQEGEWTVLMRSRPAG